MMQTHKFNILFFLLVLLFTLSFNILGQNTLPIDKTSIKRIEIPKSEIEKYRQDKVFDYEPKKASENFFVRGLNWLKQKAKAFLYKILKAIFGKKNTGRLLSFLMDSLPYIAVILFVYLI